LERRLAAILAADVVGYTALMGADEAGTLWRFTSLRQGVLEPLIAAHHGRVVKLMGDGLLVEFSSVVDAVACAVAWQKAVVEHQATTSQGARLQFRIGINLGDVIVEGDDIHGDGVNIAARLESLAKPGRICLSDDAYRQVRGKIEAVFEDLGECALKNVTEPVRVYSVATTDSGDSASPKPEAESPDLPTKPSIAVLPFINMSGDPDQEYFADGLSEDVITALSRFHSLDVAGRNSSFAYKGRSLDLKQVARELGVQYILEGSVRKAGNRVRITAQLIHGAVDRHVWAEQYDRELDDVFEVQDEITKVIVGTLVHKVDTEETERRILSSRTDRDAYDCYLAGREFFFARTRASNEKALDLMEKAIELDPGFARAYGFKAWLMAYACRYGWSDDPKQSLEDALEAALKALSLDASDYDVHWRLATVYLQGRQFGRALTEYEKARSLNPNHAGFLAEMSGALILLGRPDEAIEQLEQAKRVNPQYPEWFHANLGWAHYHSGRYESALEALNSLNAPPGVFLIFLAASYARLGRIDEAANEVARILELEPGFCLETLSFLPYKNEADRAELAADLRKAGLPE
jgi:adenylate cyclase